MQCMVQDRDELRKTRTTASPKNCCTGADVGLYEKQTQTENETCSPACHHVEKPVTIIVRMFSCCGRTQIDCVNKSKITRSVLSCVSVPYGINSRIAFQILAIVVAFMGAS